MNRIILIGNGFDLAHGLPTRYEDFINWYWERRINGFASKVTYKDEDKLFVIKSSYYTLQNFFYMIQQNKKDAKWIKEYITKDEDFYIVKTGLWSNISRSIETKGWVDIENEYYRFLKGIAKNESGFKCTLQELNKQIAYIQSLLIEYLASLDKKVSTMQALKSIIYEPIKAQDVSVAGQKALADYFEFWLRQDTNALLYKLTRFEIPHMMDYVDDLQTFRGFYHEGFPNTESVLSALKDHDEKYEEVGLRPDRILFLNFNYTANAERYFSKQKGFDFNYIHGKLGNADSIIFGYGDELDKDYNDILNLNDNEYLCNMKSTKYLESSNYRDMLSFIESAPYQVYIMGHSCGNSDRTLLNTLFEHRNCVTIKPFYYEKEAGKDNYLDLVQNISRNFTDMKLMRDRVVNKTFCEPLPQSCYLL